MLEDGLYRRFPKPDYALALHSASDLPVGSVGVRSGELLASDTSMTITLHGRGGHGAMPNKTVDPIVLASALVLDLQTIASREKDPIEPGVITVGTFNAGTKKNIIPDTATLGLTIRALNPETSHFLVESVKRHAKGLSEAHHAAPPTIEISNSSPPLINDPKLVAKALPALRDALGEAQVVSMPVSMGAEDFGELGKDGVPVMMFWLGTIAPDRMAQAKKTGKILPSLHSAEFLPDAQPSIATGVKAMTSVVTALMGVAARG